MTKFELTIAIDDRRQGKAQPRYNSYAKPDHYDAHLKKLLKLRDCHVHVQTTTVVTIYPEKTVRGLFD